MTEKYKLYISEDIKMRLINDAELFEFFKNDDTVNLNAFLKVLIVNYFEKYRLESEALLLNIAKDLEEISDISGRKASALAAKIVKNYIRPDDEGTGKSTALTLTVSGQSYEIIRIIEENMLRDSSLSGYLKDMFVSYLSIPRSRREAVIFKDTYAEINRAVAENRILSFSATTAGSDKSFRAEPYFIAESKEEQCSYLLCRDSDAGIPRTFRISRLRNVFVTSDIFEPDKKLQKELREKAVRSPHSAAKDIHAVIRLNAYGVKKFKVVTKNRPDVSSIDGDLYHFDWPEVQLEEYFKRFGRDAVVVSPKSLKDSLRKFYSLALREYS